MPPVRAEFPDLDAKSPEDLRIRYNILRDKSQSQGPLSDGELHEMVVILGALRRKSAGPPRVAKTKAPLTLADL